MPIINQHKNQSNKKQRRQRKSSKRSSLLASPEPTLRDIDDAENLNIDQLNIAVERVSICSSPTKFKKSKKSRKSTNHNKLNMKKEELVPQNVVAHQVKDPQDRLNGTEPCDTCKRFLFEPLHDEEAEVAQMRQQALGSRCMSRRRNRRERLAGQDKKETQDQFEKTQKRQPVLGCDDSRVGALQMYKNMLKDERLHFEKINKLAYNQIAKFDGILSRQGESKNVENNVLQQLDINSLQKIDSSYCNDTLVEEQPNHIDMIFPQKSLIDLRNKTIEEMIFQIGKKLKQQDLTMHLAVKLFDLVFMNQQNFFGSHEEAIEKSLSLESVTDNNLKCIRNEEKNLKLLATQCLLLASKFFEVTRIFPAEIVYQVKEWKRDEFEMLRSGQIEEYILNLISFDVWMISPADFVQLFTQSLNSTLPSRQCELNLPKEYKEMCGNKTEQKKFQLLAQQICDLIAINCGPKISLMYLPSQVAAASIRMALNSMFGQSLEMDSLNQIISENLKILGYFGNVDQYQNAIQSVINDACEIELIRQFLGITEKNRQPTNKDTLSNNDWKDLPFKISVETAPLFTPNKIKSNKALSPQKLRASCASPFKISKMRLQEQIPRISNLNKAKFDQIIYGRKLQKKNNQILSDCQSIDSDLNSQYDPTNIYPDFVFTELEKNYMITNKFFGYSQYKNTQNGQEMRKSLNHNHQDILPSLQTVIDKNTFYSNSHIHLQKQNSLTNQNGIFRNSEFQIQKQNGGELIETPINYRKRTKVNMSDATLFSNDASTASKICDKENQLMNANLQHEKDMLKDQLFETLPRYSFVSDQESNNIKPLLTRVAEIEYSKDALEDQNPFLEYEYLARVNEMNQNQHYSLIPKNIDNNQALSSDYEYLSDEDQLQESLFSQGHNYILSQQTGNLNFHPAPRHSLPDRFIHQQDMLFNICDIDQYDPINFKDEKDYNLQSSTTNSSSKMLNDITQSMTNINESQIKGDVPLRRVQKSEYLY